MVPHRNQAEDAVSERIEQALEVLEEVWARRPTVGRIRSNATRRVAIRRGRKPATVFDKMVRQLAPKVRNADDLDAIIARWWGRDGGALRDALLAAAVGDADRTRVQTFFASR
jgi:hypothetical protein